MGKIPASLVLITKNEEQNVCRLAAITDRFAETIIVDGESTDRTREVAERIGAKVYRRPFDNFAAQKNYALEKATQDWIFSLDADETPDEVLIQSIENTLNGTTDNKTAYRIRRRNFHFGKELCWGGQGNDYPVRVFRKDCARFSGIVHEVVDANGPLGTLSGELIHESNRSVGEYLQKLSHYTKLEVQLEKNRERKVSVWNYAVKPCLRFFYTYFIRLGFLDGFEGFLFHALSAFYLVIKQARLAEE